RQVDGEERGEQRQREKWPAVIIISEHLTVIVVMHPPPPLLARGASLGKSHRLGEVSALLAEFAFCTIKACLRGGNRAERIIFGAAGWQAKRQRRSEGAISSATSSRPISQPS